MRYLALFFLCLAAIGQQSMFAQTKPTQPAGQQCASTSRVDPATAAALQALALPAAYSFPPVVAYLQTADGWKKLDQSHKSGVVGKAGFMKGTAYYIYDGPAAALRTDGCPAFGLRANEGPALNGVSFGPQDLMILPMTKKKDHREVQVAVAQGTPFSMTTRTGPARGAPGVALTEAGERTWVLTPVDSLPSGEYLLTFRGAPGFMGWEFSVANN